MTENYLWKYSSAIDFSGERGLLEIDIIKVNLDTSYKLAPAWASVSLNRYLEAVKKMSPEEAAFSTWSGKQGKALGFTNVKVEKIDNGIKAVFTKP